MPPPPTAGSQPPPPAPLPPSGTGSNWKDTDRPPSVPFGPGARWGLGDAFASYGVFILSSIAIAGVAIAVNGGSDDDFLVGPWLPLVLAVPPSLQLLHVTWVARARGHGLDADFGFRFKGVDVAVAGALFIVGLVAASVAVLVMDALGAGTPDAAVADLATDSDDGSGITIWLVLMAITATTLVPVVEEAVYRGMWWSALLKRGMNERWVLAVTSLVFAAAHLEPGRTPVLLALGLALGWGRLLTGRIGAPIIAHACINAIGMIAVLASIA